MHNPTKWCGVENEMAPVRLHASWNYVISDYRAQ